MLVLSQLRHVEISYMNADLPVNHIVLVGQLDPSAMVHSISSAMYVLPAAHGSVPPVPNYSPVPTIPPPAYDQVSAAPPPNSDQVSAVPPPNYGPVPSTPPPAYEVIM